MRVVIALVLTLLLLLVALLGGALALNRVPLSGEPGVASRLAIYLGSNVAQTGPGARREELRPITLTGERDVVLEAVAAACRELGWHNVRVDRVTGSVHAEVVTRWFRFTDDVHVTLMDDIPGTVEARVRSASRVGRGDLGANTRHVMDLREALASASVGRSSLR